MFVAVSVSVCLCLTPSPSLQFLWSCLVRPFLLLPLPVSYSSRRRRRRLAVAPPHRRLAQHVLPRRRALFGVPLPLLPPQRRHVCGRQPPRPRGAGEDRPRRLPMFSSFGAPRRAAIRPGRERLFRLGLRQPRLCLPPCRQPPPVTRAIGHDGRLVAVAAACALRFCAVGPLLVLVPRPHLQHPSVPAHAVAHRPRLAHARLGPVSAACLEMAVRLLAPSLPSLHPLSLAALRFLLSSLPLAMILTTLSTTHNTHDTGGIPNERTRHASVHLFFLGVVVGSISRFQWHGIAMGIFRSRLKSHNLITIRPCSLSPAFFILRLKPTASLRLPLLLGYG